MAKSVMAQPGQARQGGARLPGRVDPGRERRHRRAVRASKRAEGALVSDVVGGSPADRGGFEVRRCHHRLRRQAGRQHRDPAQPRGRNGGRQQRQGRGHARRQAADVRDEDCRTTGGHDRKRRDRQGQREERRARRSRGDQYQPGRRPPAEPAARRAGRGGERSRIRAAPPRRPASARVT
ncbi:MAG: hypothetical protein MZW92_45980 [Comamonadaceae bacterium]|nr:hypothetical protein [Comamonadaceae bacterium]